MKYQKIGLLLNLATSSNEKHTKLALDLIDLNLIKGNESEKLDNNVESDTLGTDCFDKMVSSHIVETQKVECHLVADY